MIIDFLGEAAPPELAADLCIIGAGAAGIAIAHAFIGTPWRVCLLEGGGLAGEERNQALYEGESIGDTPFDPGVSRMRAFGGSCNLWGGGCIPLSRHDMERRDWVPHSGWPISFDELIPHYERALAYCGLPGLRFADRGFEESPAHSPLPLDGARLHNQIYATSPVLFGDAYREALRQAGNVQLVLHANLLQLASTGGGRHVDTALIGNLEGRRGRIRARHYVLAAGGIENARLLLLSDNELPHGLGNAHDTVGRYFMDHPSGPIGHLLGEHPERLTQPYDRHQGKPGIRVFPQIGLSDALQRDARLLNGRVQPFAVADEVPAGLQALREFRAALRRRALDEGALLEQRLCDAMRNGPAWAGAVGALATPPGWQPKRWHGRANGEATLATLAWRVARGSGDVARAAVQKLSHRPRVKTSHVELVGYFEQSPNPSSRISLGEHRDALGLRRVRVDWRLSELDRLSYRHSAKVFGGELASLNRGSYQPESWVEQVDAPLPLHGTAHHLGTTRMSDDPRHGVVDPQCKVHGMDNLHVAGSSVFPTGGWAFPTLTIAALSLRLASQLQGLLSGPL